MRDKTVKRRDFLPKKKAATGMSILNDKKRLCAPENVIKELIVQYIDKELPVRNLRIQNGQRKIRKAVLPP